MHQMIISIKIKSAQFAKMNKKKFILFKNV